MGGTRWSGLCVSSGRSVFVLFLGKPEGELLCLEIGVFFEGGGVFFEFAPWSEGGTPLEGEEVWFGETGGVDTATCSGQVVEGSLDGAG